jgi:hypothetical protein
LRSLLDSQSPTPENGEGGEDKESRGLNTVRYGISTQSTVH